MGHEMCGWCNCTPCECDLTEIRKKIKDNSMLDDHIMLELIKKSNLESNLPIPVTVMDWKNLPYEKKYDLFDGGFIQRLKEKLREGWIGIKFTKTNGEERDMVCTLKSDLLPKLKAKIETKPIPKERKHKDSIAVWSRDDEAWRSFRLDSIEEVWVLTPFVVR